MRVLVTGAGGFIGANLIRALLEKGHIVGALLKSRTGCWRLNELIDKIKILEANLTKKDDLKKVMEEFKPEFIFHLATYGAYPRFQKDVELMIETNVKGTMNLIEIAQNVPIVNIGSSSEYGIKDEPMREADSCRPEIDYGWAKLCQTTYCQKKGLPTLRFFSIYGPWEESTRLIPVLINAKLKGEPLNLINSVRDYVYVDDAVRAIISAAENYERIKGEIINISSGKQTSVKELLSCIEKLNQKPNQVNWNFQAAQPEPSVWTADISKAKQLLCWGPRTSIEEGIKKTYEWAEKRGGIESGLEKANINIHKKSEEIRQKIIEHHKKNKTGHIGSSLSIVEILTTLYYKIMRETDHFILAKGHASSALYAVLNDKEYLPVEEIEKLEVHPKLNKKYKIEASTGTLGHGLSIGLGMVLANNLDKKTGKVYVLMGDGECDEGQVWEAARAAFELRLNNLVAIVDCNGWQGFKANNFAMLENKFLSFGWNVKWCDGHNCEEIGKVLSETSDKPLIVLARTIKGKGLPGIEGTLASHYFHF